MLISEIKLSVQKSCTSGESCSVFDVLATVLNYANEPGVNLSMVREQLSSALGFIEEYVEEPNDLEKINKFCKIPQDF